MSLIKDHLSSFINVPLEDLPQHFHHRDLNRLGSLQFPNLPLLQTKSYFLSNVLENITKKMIYTICRNVRPLGKPAHMSITNAHMSITNAHAS